MSDEPGARERVLAHLSSLGIPFERFDHPPVATVEDGIREWAGIDAAHCKNLFLRNQKATATTC